MILCKLHTRLAVANLVTKYWHPFSCDATLISYMPHKVDKATFLKLLVCFKFFFVFFLNIFFILVGMSRMHVAFIFIPVQLIYELLPLADTLCPHRARLDVQVLHTMSQLIARFQESTDGFY